MNNDTIDLQAGILPYIHSLFDKLGVIEADLMIIPSDSVLMLLKVRLARLV